MDCRISIDVIVPNFGQGTVVIEENVSVIRRYRLSYLGVPCMQLLSKGSK